MCFILYPRVSIVKAISIDGIIIGSVLHIGDSQVLSPRCRVLAVQRELPNFHVNEGNFNLFPIFSQTIPEPEITERIQIKMINKSHQIKVNKIRVIGMSTAGVLQVGSPRIVDTEARIKHIRHLRTGERPI